MGFPFYLAMDSMEMEGYNGAQSPAWFSCQFSPVSGGLCDLPRQLPAGSVLVLDDARPYCHHDPSRIVRELAEAARQFRSAAVVLDFQKPYRQALGTLALDLENQLPCPVVVTPAYTGCTQGPVLLPPVPCHIPVEKWITDLTRPIWLEIDNRNLRLTLTETGLEQSCIQSFPSSGKVHWDKDLCCHYQICQEQATFILHRTREDLAALLARAERFGVQAAIGLYQELRPLLR